MTKPREPARAVLVGAGLVFTSLAMPQPPDSDTSAPAVVRAAVAYVKDYQQQLTAVLADESYTQQIRRQVPVDPLMARTRTMKSEVFFMFAAASREWMAIRDVVSVDGKTVDDRLELRSELQVAPTSQVGARFKNHNSRFNLGHVYRNFNEPTLSLMVLDAEHVARFTFDRKSVQRKADAVLVTLSFSERSEKGSPSLIRDQLFRPVLSHGELTVEAGTGRVRHAVLKANVNGVQAVLTTTYESEARLGMWVPSVFQEVYEQGIEVARVRGGTMDYEEVLCEAQYTGFRRFEVRTRIK